MSTITLGTLPTMRRSKFWRFVNAVVTVTARDVTLIVRSPGTLAMSVVMPIVMMGLVGGNLMQNMTSGLTYDFGTFMLVGMLINQLFMTTTMGMSSLVDDSDDHFSAELLVSPASRYAIVIGKILGSGFMALISAIIVVVVGLVMGLRLAGWQMLALLALSPLMVLAGGALAMMVYGFVRSKKAANMVGMLITMPSMFLSGVIIPITHSSGILLILSRMLPMTYCVDLGRAIVYAGSPQYSSVVLFNPAISLAAIIALTVICLIVGTYFYVRAEKNR